MELLISISIAECKMLAGHFTYFAYFNTCCFVKFYCYFANFTEISFHRSVFTWLHYLLPCRKMIADYFLYSCTLWYVLLLVASRKMFASHFIYRAILIWFQHWLPSAKCFLQHFIYLFIWLYFFLLYSKPLHKFRCLLGPISFC